KKILKRLDFGISVENKETLKVSPPSFRPDIVSKVDIIEEVSRVIGYDKLPLSLPKIQRVNIEPNKQRQRRKETEKALLAQGFSEIITFSMTEQNKLEMSEINATSGIKIKNPLSLDQEVMRSSLLPSTLSVVQTNLNRGEKKLKFYEFGKIYTENKEQDVLSLFLCGETLFDWRSKDRKIAEFYDLKGSVENLYSSLGITNLVFQAKEEPFFEKGQSCFIYQNKTKIGSLGLLKENVLAKWNIKERQCYFAQMDLEVIYRIEKDIKKFQPIIGYPSIVRDVSLAVKQDVSFQDIKNIIYENCGSLLSDVRFTEEYLGDKIEFGYRGLVFSLIYQSEERTLKEEEINDVHEKIVQELIQKLAVIRR
ncbi:MAG: hypothetical protein KC733_00585, partial [Candidatus Omnitrophica bacterium]|nr:hypothetical protein [Candidatus Omnitrophota bacterium]